MTSAIEWLECRFDIKQEIHKSYAPNLPLSAATGMYTIKEDILNCGMKEDTARWPIPFYDDDLEYWSGT